MRHRMSFDAINNLKADIKCGSFYQKDRGWQFREARLAIAGAGFCIFTALYTISICGFAQFPSFTQARDSEEFIIQKRTTSKREQLPANQEQYRNYPANRQRCGNRGHY